MMPAALALDWSSCWVVVRRVFVETVEYWIVSCLPPFVHGVVEQLYPSDSRICFAFAGSYVNCEKGWTSLHQLPMFGNDTNPQFSTEALGLFNLMMALTTACRSTAYISASRTLGSFSGGDSTLNHRASK